MRKAKIINNRPQKTKVKSATNTQAVQAQKYNDSALIERIEALESLTSALQKQLDSLRKETVREINKAQNDVERIKKAGK